MYISFLLMIRLLILPFSYLLAVVVFWKDVGSLVLLLGIIPLVINTILFSYPVLNYISTLIFTFLIFYIMKIPGDYVFYETEFWGVQAIWILAVISTVILKKIFVPVGSVKRRRVLADFFHNRDNEVVVFDCRHKSIASITKGALKFYGWKKQKLLDYSLLRLHIHDFITNPPEGFWETLEKGQAWHGFLDVHTKNGDIYEERACYRGCKNSRGEIEKIEKKIIEVLYKEVNNTTYEHYKIFFEQSPVMMAVVNNIGVIEQANESFMREIPIKPVLYESFFSELFPIDMRFKIYQTLTDVVSSDSQEVFSSSFNGVHESFSAQFSFHPYKYMTDKSVSKILFMLYREPLYIESHQKEIEDENIQHISVATMLKDVLTQIYKEYPNPLLKLMSGSLPSIGIQYSLWYDFFYHILTLVLQHNSFVENKVIITSTAKEEKTHLFRIYFQGSNYQQSEQINSSQYDRCILEDSLDVRAILEKFADNFEIVNQDDNTMIINFEFQEK